MNEVNVRISGMVELAEKAAQASDMMAIMNDRFQKHGLHLDYFGAIERWVVYLDAVEVKRFPTFAQAFDYAVAIYIGEVIA